MRLTHALVIVALGFFALVAQTLLFREFLTAFEGNELGIGSFFGSWLVWVAVGALVGRWVAARVLEGGQESAGGAGRHVGRAGSAAARGGQAPSHKSSREGEDGAGGSELVPVSVTGGFELLTLLYVPAFLLQQHLIASARAWSGVSPYEIYPFAQMATAALWANAPVSLLTGLLFTLACCWSSREHGLPVARVYILETAGAFLGGIAITLLLSRGVDGETIFVSLVLLLALSAGLSCLAQRGKHNGRPRWFAVIPLSVTVIALLLLGSGTCRHWSECRHRAAWQRLLPAQGYRGSFTTAQARYSFGEREGQFVVMSWGGVSESLPDTEHASEVVALSLAQNPGARSVLVIGTESLSICTRLTELPMIERVVWLHPDPDYPQALLAALPDGYRSASARVEVPGVEVRQFLRRCPERFDLVLLNLPDATTLVLNRYSTRELYTMVKGVLADGGVVCTRVSGAANYLGSELVYLGCSALATVESVFRQVVIKPGDESWLIASDGQRLSTSPDCLRDRFAAIPGAASLFPPEGLLSLYVPDRAEFQLGKYRQAMADADASLLLNVDRQPKALLFSMLLMLRRAEVLSLGEHLPTLLAASFWLAICPVAIYGILRVAYLRSGRSARHNIGASPSGEGELVASERAGSVFDGHVLIWSTGLAGMSLSIVLMFLYQSRFGSLFLDIGLVSSLFMLGSSIGGILGERLLVVRRTEPRLLLPGLIVAHLLLILLVILLPITTPRVSYALLFVGSGLFVGVYFPLAAYRLRSTGQGAARAGSVLETLDHLGGAVGAVLTGWLLLPLLGSSLTLVVLTTTVGVNLVPGLALAIPPPRLTRRASGDDWFDRLIRPASYTMFGIGVLLLASRQIVVLAGAGQEGRRLLVAAQELAGEGGLSEQQAMLTDGSMLTYFATGAPDAPALGYVFGSARLTPGIRGYGGPIGLAIAVDHTGTLRGLRIVASNETPAYLDSLRDWLAQLPGHNLFGADALSDVDAVSGASMTCRALVRTLAESGRGFATQVLGMDVGGQSPPAHGWLPDRQFLWLTGFMVLAIVLRRRPRRWPRRLFLLASLLILGVLLNLQYSSQQVLALLNHNWPGLALTGPFFLLVLVPLSVLFWGNIYCGYVCPFGALQELIGDLRPHQLVDDPDKRVWRYGRMVKYVLLFWLVALFAFSGDYSILSADPLIAFFSPLRDWAVIVTGGTIVAFALVFRRFWCRNLCPAGAFLALLCGLEPIKRLLPPTGPGRCDLGVRGTGELDCLCCDRCRHEKS